MFIDAERAGDVARCTRPEAFSQTQRIPRQSACDAECKPDLAILEPSAADSMMRRTVRQHRGSANEFGRGTVEVELTWGQRPVMAREIDA